MKAEKAKPNRNRTDELKACGEVLVKIAEVLAPYTAEQQAAIMAAACSHLGHYQQAEQFNRAAFRFSEDRES